LTKQVEKTEAARQESYPALTVTLIVLATALPIIVLPGGYLGFAPVRQWLLTSMSLLAVVILVAYWLKRRRVTLLLTGVEIPWAALLLVLLISTLLSKYMVTSIWGSFSFREGLVSWAAYFIVFFLAAQAFREKRNCSRLVRMLKYASVVIAAYGILQFAGADPLKSLVPSFQGKASSFLGSPVYLAGYLVLVAPLFLCLAANPEAPKKERRSNILVFVFLMIAVVLTASRAAWIALALVVALVVSYALFKRGRTAVKALLVGFGGVLVVVVVIFGLASGVSGEFRKRAFSSAENILTKDSIRTNTLFRAFSVIASKPLLGHGLGTYEFVFPAHIDVSWEKNNSHDPLPDDPQNIILGISASAGLAGLAVFVWLMLSIFAQAVKRMVQADRQTRYLLGGFLLGGLGYLVHLLFHSSIIATTALFWIFVGCALSMPLVGTKTQEQEEEAVEEPVTPATERREKLARRVKEINIPPDRPGRLVLAWLGLGAALLMYGASVVFLIRPVIADVYLRKDRPGRLVLAWLGLGAALLLCAASVVFLIRPVIADVDLRKAMDNSASGKQMIAAQDASRAASRDTRYGFARLVEGQVLLKKAIATESPDLFRKTEEKLGALVKDYPDWETAATALGYVYLTDFESWAKRPLPEKKELVTKGRRVFEAIVKRDPEYADAQVKLARFELYSTFYDNALKRLKRVIELKPNWPEPYTVAGNCYLWKGKGKIASRYFQKAQELSSAPSP